MYCKYCGAEIKKEANFCEYCCGTRLVDKKIKKGTKIIL